MQANSGDPIIGHHRIDQCRHADHRLIAQGQHISDWQPRRLHRQVN